MKKLTGVAHGHNGTIKYEIDMDGNRIDDLQVLSHAETSGIFDQVIGKLKESVIEQQSFDVDAISGATVMTKSILDSAKQVINDEHIQLDSKPKKHQDNRLKRLTTDVLVIGGGEAGLVSACRALAEGRDVILVEKNGYMGGATILNGSNVVATGSNVAARVLGKNGDSPARLAADVSRECNDTNILELTNLMATNIGAAIDFISDFAGLDYQKAQTQTPEHSVERQVELPSSSSYEFIQKVTAAFKEKGGQVLLGTRVEDMLINSAGVVRGVIAATQGATYRIKANSVVLASGGFGANQRMRGSESVGLDYYGPMTSTGDAYSFNKALNLKSHDLGWYKVYPHGVEVEPGIAKLTTYASKKATDMGAVYVNQNGQRIVNESDVYTKLRDAVLKQPGKVAYLLMDKRTWNEFYSLLVLHDFEEDEIKQFFAQKDKRPYFVKGSLREVATTVGIDPAQLQITVDEYNAAAKAGVDQKFNRGKQYLHQYEGDEYYLVEQRDRFATTLGGYSVQADNMQLVTTTGQPVANYYAAGEVVGGANGHDSAPSMMNSWGISSGYVAGKAASDNAVNHQQQVSRHFVGIVGTNAEHSYNRKLLYAMQDLFEDDAEIDIHEVRGIPMFDEGIADQLPEEIQRLQTAIEQSDGVIIATPEYDHSIPAALKSVLEWLSSSIHPLKGKKVMIVGTSLGVQGTVRAQMNLRQILDCPGVDAKVMPGNEYMLPHAADAFDDNEAIKDAGSVSFLKECFANFMTFTKEEN
ncbi:FAD-dependent oxidoreductase [Ligilactobacillus sp. LYQ139]|uniref:FAD-dependent oxidoreductase n=1 Tax=Ligilactobacillus sp. LYQ139 TaxID=3378800 RepID=UPI003854840D